MKKYTLLLAAVMALFTFAPAVAAPLFGDVPEEHWARDAVANLAAKGLVEGYPDGTFKGARAATRYEMAMVVARLLAKNEQENATFATKADLEDLRRLVGQLKNELDALGVRVTNLEDSVSKLDKRVTELERITFYGELDSFFVTQGFELKEDVTPMIHMGGDERYHAWGPNNIAGIAHMTDQGDLGMLHTNTTLFRNPGAVRNYNSLVGTIGGANMTPFDNGVFPVADYRTGRPLTNGTGFSIRAIFGVNAKVSEDVDAGLELAAYSSIGDPVVNSYYGASAPYSSNPFTASNNGMGDIFGGGNTMMGYANAPGNSPWTRVTLDNFWIKHKPSGIKLVAGSFGELHMDPILYAGQPNPNVNGPKYLNNNGVRIFGSTNLFSDVDWEVFYTNLADGDPYAYRGQVPQYQDDSMFYQGTPYGSDYNTYAYGASLAWHFEGGNFKIGYLKAQNDTTADFNVGYSGNGIFSMGQEGGNYLNPLGQQSSNPFGWVNPEGYFAVQLAGGDPSQAIPANTNWMNRSPIFTYAGGNALRADLVSSDGSWGGYGAQETTNWSAHFDYMWDGPSPVRFMAEYAGSEWKPNKESDFSKSGSAFRGGLGITLFQGSLDLDATYKSAEAFFDPFTLRYPNGVNSMWRFPSMSYFSDMYQLHDSDMYPNNRTGWDFKAAYRFNDDRGKAWVSYESLEQETSSVYDQRFYAGQVNGVNNANLIPNDLVFGYTPGFIEPVFTPYAMGTYYMWSAPNPENIGNWGAPLEDQKGKSSKWSAGIDYKFPESNFGIEASFFNQNFKRHSDLEIGQVVNLGAGNWNVGVAPSANHIDLDMQNFHIGVSYPFNEKFTAKAGYDMTTFRGHYDPNNIYSVYAMHTGSKDFVNVDTQQSVPYIGFDYKLSKNTEWGLNLQFFSTIDKIGSDLSPRYTLTDQSVEDTQLSNINPFSWEGIQLMTEFKVKF